MVCPFGCDPSTRIEEGAITEMGINWWPHWQDGVRHMHDPNRKWQRFRCHYNHAWERRWFDPCPACGHTEGTPEEVGTFMIDGRRLRVEIDG